MKKEQNKTKQDKIVESKKPKKIKKEKKVEKAVEILADNNETAKSKRTRRPYFSFGSRIIINIILLIIIFISFCVLLNQSFEITKKEKITYTEKSNIDYLVLLKDNNFYEERYLEKNMAYVASLIENIKINYDYVFEVDKKSNIDISYKIVAKLVIASQYNSNIFYEKEYVLLDEVKDEIKNSNQYIINEDVIIDYNEYNDLVNRFKSNYAVNTTSNLEVILYVNENSKNDNSFTLSNQGTASLVIPLSQQEISINLDNQNINNKKDIVNNPKIIIKNPIYAGLATALLLIFIIYLFIVFKKYYLDTRKKVSAYDKYVNRILRGYDRIIINVKTAPKLENYNVIKVENFQELVDVRDNTKEPIIYYVIIEHQKCEFFVINNQDLYIYIVKEIDLMGK